MDKLLEKVESEIQKRNISNSEISQILSSIPQVTNRRIVYGYASVAMIDRENQKISIPALKEAVKRFMAEDKYRILTIFHCLDPDTKILACKKGNKYIPISKIKVGDKVYSHTGVLRKVNEVFSYFINCDLNKIILSNDEEIFITDEHQVLTRDRGWVKSKDLLETDILLHCPPKQMAESGKIGGKKMIEKTKGKTLEEIYGFVLASKMKENMSLNYNHNNIGPKNRANQVRGLTLSEIYGEEKAKEIILKIAVPRENYTLTDKHNSQQRKGKTWKETYGHERPNYGGNAGEKNSMWKGGISALPYPFEFNDKKEFVRLRDNHVCQLCGRTQSQELEKRHHKLNVHHVDYDKNNCDNLNLITLCCVCNGKVNYKREYWAEYFQKQLQNRIPLVNGTSIKQIKRVWYTGMVYNLDVDIDHTYVGKGIVYHNSDAVVGRVLPKWTDPKTGEEYKTEVDDLGWKIVGELRTDLELANKIWDEIQKGNIRSFSVAGSSKAKHEAMQNGMPYTEIDELDLLEITFCTVPVNQMAVFSILYDPKEIKI